MRCVEPFVKAGEVYPCGRCLPCKFKERRIWFRRVMLEASQHDHSTVVTLTYDDASIPEDGSLRPEHLRNWLKRIRKLNSERYDWRRLRFMACGEYGEGTGRPHYHAIMFGLPGCEFGRSGRLWCSGCGCETCTDITGTWTMGESSVDSLSPQSAAYVAGYVTRKVLAKNFGTRLPPFRRMSNGSRGEGGIGASAMHDVASTVLQYNLDPSRVSVGRYLRRKLHEAVDQAVPSFAPNAAMQAVRVFAWVNSRSIQGVYREIFTPLASQLQQKEALKETLL